MRSSQNIRLEYLLCFYKNKYLKSRLFFACQKSKTPIKIPIKNVPYTPSSIPRAKFPFKRPTPLTNIKSWQNKFSRHFLLMSEPRRTSANKQHTVNRFSASTKLIQPKNLTRQSLDNDLNK